MRFVGDATTRAFEDVATRSRQAVATAKTDTQALMREIAGQGPEKTLSRGFALVRGADGNAITSASSTEAQVTIQFRDGVRSAQLREDNKP
jgi:exodeoxyribonuclease VII large subunit